MIPEAVKELLNEYQNTDIRSLISKNKDAAKLFEQYSKMYDALIGGEVPKNISVRAVVYFMYYD